MTDDDLYLEEEKLREILDMAHNYEVEWGKSPDEALVIAMDQVRRSLDRERGPKE